ncbi:MAG: sigma-70 family RNA polymerase sigma factor [Candidatus Pseudobacter hemicellulosilyticus]|uniref:Sigma-70 family RNA polymerase sigma factor n=1 Tax=Candidatus Pseudobacter hemicellulosilyticus TaxID=3121375 RepID=A0AAJ5WQS8_9BACT|nr:MAG: sigma-70 family RNA polymerase sigma factor [Pseudobacter sp.]
MEGLKAGGLQRRAAEKQLYEQFFYFIDQGARKHRLGEEDCASAYSDTIITVIEHVLGERFEGRSSLKTYTYQIFSNKCVDLVRKSSTNKNRVLHTQVLDPLVQLLPDRARTVVQQLMDKSDRKLLLQKLRELGDKCRELLLLFEDGYNDREIAGQMQYQSAEVVKTTRLRCLGKLREKILSTGR